jgi:type VII secretion effector (TIGR04197 family)
MKKINTDTIKGTVITNDLPEIMESVDSSITDDSKAVLEQAVSQLTQTNKKLKKSLKQLNKYIDNMAEAFEEVDKGISKKIEENTVAVNTDSTRSSKGTERYLAAIPV